MVAIRGIGDRLDRRSTEEEAQKKKKKKNRKKKNGGLHGGKKHRRRMVGCTVVVQCVKMSVSTVEEVHFFSV